MKALKSFKKAEIKKHNKPDDAWVTCGGYVHDITKFMNSHPGGVDYLIPVLGDDCEEQMQEHNHSSFSYSLLKTYCIGVIEGATLRQHHPIEPHHLRGYKSADLENMVDLEKATLPQIYDLGDKYWPWLINRPVVKDNQLRIFTQNALEAMSHYPWFYIWFLWLPVLLISLYWGYELTMDNVAASYRTSSSSSGSAVMTKTQQLFDTTRILAVSFVVGALFWSIVEYTLHRWVFHMEVFTPAGNVFHYFAHGIHHLVPTDSSRLTFPPTFGIALGYLFYHGYKAVIPILAAGTTLSYNGFFSGFILGYCMYDTMHYFFHHSASTNWIFTRLKAAHMNHHYKNEFANFGVSSPIWDFVFGTWDAEAESKKA